MKSILSVLLAAVLLLGALSGCARDMSGESRTTPTPAATSTAAAKNTASSAAPTDSTADGVIDEGKDAVDGVVGAGEDAVNDVVDGAEDMVDDITGADSTDKPEATPRATAKH